MPKPGSFVVGWEVGRRLGARSMSWKQRCCWQGTESCKHHKSFRHDVTPLKAALGKMGSTHRVHLVCCSLPSNGHLPFTPLEASRHDVRIEGKRQSSCTQVAFHFERLYSSTQPTLSCSPCSHEARALSSCIPPSTVNRPPLGWSKNR